MTPQSKLLDLVSNTVFVVSWLWLIASGKYKCVKPCLFWGKEKEWVPNASNLLELQGMLLYVRDSMISGAECYFYDCDSKTGELTEEEIQ